MSQTVHAIKNNNYFPLEEDNFAWKKKKKKNLTQAQLHCNVSCGHCYYPMVFLVSKVRHYIKK